MAVDAVRRLPDERPATGRLGRAEAVSRPGRRRPAGAAAAGPLPAQRPERRERVVGDLAGPDQVPQGVEHLPVRAAAGRREQLAVERGAAPAEVLADGLVAGLARRAHAVGGAGRSERARDPAGRGRSGRRRGRGCPRPPRRPRPARRARRGVAAGSRGCAPGRTSRSSTEAGSGDARPAGRRPRPVAPGRRSRGTAAARPPTAASPCQVRQEPGERGRVDRLHLAPQAGERASAEEPQDVRVAPLALGTAGTELAAKERAGGGSRSSASSTMPTGRPQRRAGSGDRNGPWVRAQRASSEPRAPRAGPRNAPGIADRRATRRPRRDTAPRPRSRSSGRRRRSASATARRVAASSCEPGRRDARSAGRPGRDLPAAEVAEPAQQVVDLVQRRRPPVLGERLQAQLEVGQRLGVQQLAQLLLAQQLAQQVAVEGQRAGAALGQRRVAVVHVGGDVVEQEAARERRGPGRLDAVDRDLAPGDAGQDLAQGRQVEDVATGTRDTSRRGSGSCRTRLATASRSAERWRCCQSGVRVPGRRRGRSRARAAFSRNRLANRAEVASWPTTRSSSSSGSGKSSASIAVERRVALGQADGDAVVGPDRLDLDAQALAAAAPRWPASTARGRGHRTGSAGTGASRRARRGSARRRRAGRSGRAPVASRSSSR